MSDTDAHTTLHSMHTELYTYTVQLSIKTDLFAAISYDEVEGENEK